MSDPREVARQVSRIMIRTPELELFDTLVERLIRRAGDYENPGGIRVIGPTGTGKTFLRRHLVARHPIVDDGFRRIVPVVAIELESAPNTRQIGERFLESIGYPFTRRKTAAQLRDICVSAVRQLGIRIFVIDEFQHVAEGRRKNTVREITDWLKLFVQDARVALITMGTEVMEQAFPPGSQLGSRLSALVVLQRIKPEQFRTLLKSYNASLPVKLGIDFDDPRNVTALYESAGASMRDLNNLLCEAVYQAVDQNSEVISIDWLKRAHRLVFGDRQNPFDQL